MLITAAIATMTNVPDDGVAEAAAVLEPGGRQLGEQIEAQP